MVKEIPIIMEKTTGRSMYAPSIHPFPGAVEVNVSILLIMLSVSTEIEEIPCIYDLPTPIVNESLHGTHYAL